jgi:hypothetical protein
MKRNPLNRNVLTDCSTRTGPVTREQVQARTRELAGIAGRTPQQVMQADYERAKRELTGETDPDRQDAVLDALPGEKRWAPLPGSTGHLFLYSSREDEDAEGRSVAEQLVDEGGIETRRDRQFRAARAAHAGDRTQTEISPSP